MVADQRAPAKAVGEKPVRLDAATRARHRKLAEAIIANEQAWRDWSAAKTDDEQRWRHAICEERSTFMGDVGATNEERAIAMLALLDETEP